jgi:Uma2 family endonuclease
MVGVSVEPAPHRFTVEEYEALGRLEEFWDGPRLELIEGKIVEMTPIGPDHAGDVMWLNAELVPRLGDRAVVRVQSPLRLGDLSEPEPDVTVLVPPLDRYRRRHPVAEDVLLLIEVSNSSLRFDRQTKVPLYARHGVAEVWIVDLTGETVEVYREPSADGYGAVERYGRGESASPAAFPDVELSVDELLG